MSTLSTIRGAESSSLFQNLKGCIIVKYMRRLSTVCIFTGQTALKVVQHCTYLYSIFFKKCTSIPWEYHQSELLHDIPCQEYRSGMATEIAIVGNHCNYLSTARHIQRKIKWV